MKKIFTMLMTSAFVASVSFNCVAKVPETQISLGGVVPGATVNSVKAIYGEPVSSYDGETLTFNNGLVVKVDEERPDIVEEVIITSGSEKITTPAGISVGMDDTLLNVAYGTADNVDYERNFVEYVYYSDDTKKKMEFKVEDGVIVKIKCELRG